MKLYKKTRILKQLCCLWTVLLLFTGCVMIGPDFSPPEAPVAPKWQESEGKYTRSDSRTTDSRWWEQMKQRTDWGELLDINNQKPDMDVSKDKDLWRALGC